MSPDFAGGGSPPLLFGECWYGRTGGDDPAAESSQRPCLYADSEEG
jgi:hypothetical protein